MRSIGGKQMRSISGMLSDELAGDAMRRVPLPVKNAFRRPGRWREATRADTFVRSLP